MQIGDKIDFGKYTWRVLDIQEDKMLIITEKIIEQRPYHEVYEDITWAECSLRHYLNHTFYESFEEKDRARILTITNENADNEWYGTKGGEKTQDRIFLLSMEEAVCKYFGDSSSKLYNPGKNQRYWFERKDMNNSKRTAYYKEGIWWWWLRSPGRVSVKAVYIHGDGNIGIQGNNIFKGNISEGKCRGGLRPALWLQL